MMPSLNFIKPEVNSSPSPVQVTAARRAVTMNRTNTTVTTYDPPNSDGGYDGSFTSSVVSEKKRFLWEIKDFEEILDNGVMRAMRFEFEMGRLGSLEKHLPRKSKWRVTLDKVGQDPELTIQLLFPDDKVIFYKFFAQIMDGPQIETDVTTRKDPNNFRFKEALTNRSVGNRFPLRPDFGERVRDWSLRNSVSQHSLFFKIEMEIMEDSSTF